MTDTTASAECVVVLDRDGTINVDCHYLRGPRRLELLPGSAAALRRFNELGFRVIVITNQSGIARGLMTLADVEAVNCELLRAVQEAGGRIDAFYLCPHHPDDACECRKPGTALLERAAVDLHFDPACAYVVGDKCSDIEMGRRAGAHTILITATHVATPEDCRPDFIAADLLAAVAIIVTHPSTASPQRHREANS